MKCPHCLTAFHATFTDTLLLHQQAHLIDTDGVWWHRLTKCPECGRAVIILRLCSAQNWDHVLNEIMVWPKGFARAPLPAEIPKEFADDYREACNVVADSPKASAALSRRCLQRLVREKGGLKKSNLYDEIEEVIGTKALPSDLADALHHVRVIGNFAAHPEKSTSTGEIVDVQPGEAEWTLDVLESLFDFYFVRPAKLAERKAALGKKLADAGKPPLKQ